MQSICQCCAKKILKMDECEVCIVKAQAVDAEVPKKKVVTQTVLGNLPERVLNTISQNLSLADKKNCRLVCEEWCTIISKFVGFGFWLNDGSACWIQDTKVSMAFLVVSDLSAPLNFNKTLFALQTKILVFEVSRNSFVKDEAENFESRNTVQLDQFIYGYTDPSKLFLPRDTQSIDDANMTFLLNEAKNVTVLVFNHYALSNYIKCGFSNDAPVMGGNSFEMLRCLTVTVSGMEIYVMENLFKHKYPALRSLCVRFYYLKRTVTLEQYECVFKFLHKHRNTLRIFEIYDPPLPPKVTTSTSTKKQHKQGDWCYCTILGITTSNGQIIKKTTHTSSAMSRNKSRIFKTTTTTTTTGTCCPRVKGCSEDKCSDDCPKRITKITKAASVESLKTLTKELDEVTELIDIKIVFKTNISGKWLPGLHLLQQQANLQELYLEGMQMSTVYDTISRNAKTLKVLHVYSPLLVSANTPGTTETNSSTFNSEVLRNCVSLQSLTLNSFQYFTTMFTRYLLPNSSNHIRLLELTIGSDMLEQYFEGLSQKLFNLQTLILKSTKVLHDKMILSFIQDCQNLKKIFLTKISEDLLNFLQITHGIYINQISNDSWAILHPTCDSTGGYPKFNIPANLIDNQLNAGNKNKKKMNDGRCYGKKYCPVIPHYPVLFILFGSYVNREDLKIRCHGQLEKILNLNQVARQMSSGSPTTATTSTSSS